MKNEAYINSVNLKEDTDFPYLVLDVVNDESTPRNPGFQVMHWHEDLQFIYVLAGGIEVVTLADCIPLQQGEGIFINKNVVHQVRKVGTCHYNSFIFPDRLLKFYPGSPAERMVDCITTCAELPICALRLAEENRAVMQSLQNLTKLEAQKTELYPYEVLTGLCQLWLAFSRTITAVEVRPRNSVAEKRVETFLQYIASHFSEDISLEDLATSASVSKAECLRCFKAVLHTTPYRYLMEYRLSRAAELLQRTSAPVSEIAAEVGFNHISHFGKCFREKTGMTPSEYRRQA